MAQTLVLGTDRLSGRPVVTTDFGRIRSIHSDARAAATLSADGRPFSKAHTRQALYVWKKHWDEHGFGVWLFHKIDGEFVGYAGTMRASIDGKPEVEVLYALRSDFWGNHFATEMARAVVQFTVERHGVTELVAYTLPTNIGSRRVMEKCGFEYEKDTVHAGLRHVLYRLDGLRFRKTSDSSLLR
ncbi:MAG TPA: GNAT family N-acetyltransferase [Candidatus Binataceae bacterium]|nr:GNAT family N-acetyltransferase [Candidatus Binataceae bacterium]